MMPSAVSEAPALVYVPARVPIRAAPELGWVVSVWWSAAWRGLLASILLTVPAAMVGAWYMTATGFDFLLWLTTGAGHGQFIAVVGLMTGAAQITAGVWALQVALWLHGVTGPAERY